MVQRYLCPQLTWYIWGLQILARVLHSSYGARKSMSVVYIVRMGPIIGGHRLYRAEFHPPESGFGVDFEIGLLINRKQYITLMLDIYICSYFLHSLTDRLYRLSVRLY